MKFKRKPRPKTEENSDDKLFEPVSLIDKELAQRIYLTRGKDPNRPKFSRSETEYFIRKVQLYICMWHALAFPCRAISEMLLENFKIRMQPSVVWTYKSNPKFREVIKYCRDKYLENIKKIPLASKMKRLHYLQKKLMDVINLPGTKSALAVSKIVEQARREVEGFGKVVLGGEGTTLVLGDMNVTELEKMEDEEINAKILQGLKSQGKSDEDPRPRFALPN